MINCTLSGISFVDLPHITNSSRDDFGQLVKGEEAIVHRETGALWDSDARPAYSVRIEGMHVGYIPLVETAKEEYIRAREGFRKIWKSEYEDMSKEQLREASRVLIETGELPKMHDWEFVGIDTMGRHARFMFDKCIFIEMVRDEMYTDFHRNHLETRCTVQAVYYDEKEGRNYKEIGDICSVSATFDID